MPSGIHNLFQTFFNWTEIRQVLPQLLSVGLLNTVILAVSAIVSGTVIGLILATLLVSRKSLLRFPARAFVDVFRGLPIIVTILLVGQGLPIAGIRPFGRSSYPYAVMALAIVSGAFIAEIFRSGIQSVERGQMEAARSLGLSHLQAMVQVVIPQGIRRVLPALANQFVAMVKDSSLVYLLGLLSSQRELFSIAQDATNNTGSLSPMVAAGAFYLALTVPLTHLVNIFDSRLRQGRSLIGSRDQAPLALRSNLEVG